MENLQEEMMINIKISSFEEEEFTKNRLPPNSLKHLNLEKPRMLWSDFPACLREIFLLFH